MPLFIDGYNMLQQFSFPSSNILEQHLTRDAGNLDFTVHDFTALKHPSASDFVWFQAGLGNDANAANYLQTLRRLEN